MKRIFPFFLLCLSALPAAAQIALDDYRRDVEEYSRLLRMAAARTEAAVQTAERARTDFLPRLSLDGSFAVAARRTDGVERGTFGVLPQIVQTLYGGGVRAEYRRARLGTDAARSDEAFTRLDVRYAADYAYWNLSSLEAFAAARREYVEIIRSLKRIIDRRFAEGYIAKGDVLMIDARLSEAEYALESVERSRDLAIHNFNTLRGAPADAPVVLAQSIRDSVPDLRRAGDTLALARRPDYAAALSRADYAAEGVNVARAAYDPHVSVGAGGSWQPRSPNRTGATVVDGTLFVKVSVPLFHWGERRRAVGAARAAADESAWSAAQLRDDIVREESDGWTAVVVSAAQVEATRESLRIAGENLDLSTYSYGEGMATILDVLQAQLNWIQLYTNSIQAHCDRALARAGYLRITAQEL